MKQVYYILIAFLLFVGGDTFAHESFKNNEVVIHMTRNGFVPNEITIVSGQHVVFENTDSKDHWPASNIHPTHRAYPDSDIKDCNSPKERFMFDACRGVAPGGTYTFAFNTEGEWRFHDHLNAELSGKIIVSAQDTILAASIKKEEGFLLRLWRGLKTFIAAVFHTNTVATIDTPAGDKTVDYDNDKDGGITHRVYDETISRADESIATNDDKLFSHVKKYGAKATLTQLFSLESQYGNCHDNAHDVGRFTYELFDANAFKECAMVCQSGCYHGAVEAYFRAHGTANFETNIGKLCTDDLNPFIRHQCVHGVGHGMMAWTNYDLFEALENCDLLPTGKSSCYSGVFMENIVQSMASFAGPEGHTTRFLSDDPHYPCTVVDDAYKGTCYFLQTDRMIQLFASDFSKVAVACGEVENNFFRQMCFESMGRTVGGHNRHNPSGAVATCHVVPEGGDRSSCLSGAVQDTFWAPEGQEDGIEFCRLVTDAGDKDACYDTIFARAPQVLTLEKDLVAFCNKAERPYIEKCLAAI